MGLFLCQPQSSEIVLGFVADSAEATGLKWATPTSGSTYSGCSLYDTSNQSIANNTYTALTWNSENFDTDAYHSTSSNTSRITIPAGKGGKYLFNLKTQFIDQNTGGRNIALYKNGALVMESEFSLSTRGQLNLALQTVQNAVATDYYEFFVKHTQGTTESFIKTQTVAEFSASLLGA